MQDHYSISPVDFLLETFRASAFFSAYFKSKVSKANIMNWLTTVVEMMKILLTCLS